MTDIKEEIAKAFFEYRKGVVDVRDDMNKGYLDYRTNNLMQRRELWKYIASISLAILGLSSFILEKSYHHTLTAISLGLYGLLVALIVFYLRELLDFEENELQKQQDTYNICSEDAIKLVDTYIEAERFTVDDYKKFWIEIKSSKSAKDLEEENEQLKSNRAKRNEQLDYFGEVIVFILVSASFLMILGSFQKELPTPIFVYSFILIFGLSFSNFVMRFSKIISKGIALLKKKF